MLHTNRRAFFDGMRRRRQGTVRSRPRHRCLLIQCIATRFPGRTSPSSLCSSDLSLHALLRLPISSSFQRRPLFWIRLLCGFPFLPLWWCVEKRRFFWPFSTTKVRAVFAFPLLSLRLGKKRTKRIPAQTRIWRTTRGTTTDARRKMDGRSAGDHRSNYPLLRRSGFPLLLRALKKINRGNKRHRRDTHLMER